MTDLATGFSMPAQWRSLWPTVFLLPGLVAVSIAVAGGPLLAPATAWCQDWWWTLLVFGTLAFLGARFLSRL